MGEMADVDEVGMSLGAEISPRVGLEGTGSKGREAEELPCRIAESKNNERIASSC